MRKRLLGSSLTVCSLGLLLAPSLLAQSDADLTLAQLAANRHAERICSGVFLSNRTPDDILRNDHDTDPATVSVDVNRVSGVVTVKAGPSTGVAVMRPGLGCTVLVRLSPQQLADQPTGRPLPAPPALDEPWPQGSRVEVATPPGLDRQRLEATFDEAFSEPDPDVRRGTRAALVVYDGKIVAERYAPGFGPDRPLNIWSMTKTLNSALVGMLVGEGKLDLHAPASVPEWQTPGDGRAKITLDQLMRMSSGLEFQEVYEAGLIDVVLMLFLEPDMAHFAAAKPLEVEPDSRWEYSSGTTNILSRIVRDAVGGNLEDYVAFPRRALFDPLHMDHTVVELDESGTFVASSFGYSTPRDLARFGLLYLHNGAWDGVRLLPEGWVAYSTTPTPGAAKGEYGAQTWLNRGAPEDPANRQWPHVPRDAFGLSGFEGQSVTVVPSRNAVIVRLGRTPDQHGFDLDRFLADVLSTLPPAP